MYKESTLQLIRFDQKYNIYLIYMLADYKNFSMDIQHKSILVYYIINDQITNSVVFNDY